MDAQNQPNQSQEETEQQQHDELIAALEAIALEIRSLNHFLQDAL